MSGRRVALTLGVVATYAVCYSGIKIGLEFAPALRFAGLRAGIGGLVLLGILAVTGQRLVPPRSLWPAVGVLGVVGTFAEYGAMFLSPGRTGAGLASVLGNTGPLILTAMGVGLLGEPLTRRKVEAVGLGGIGVALIAAPAFTAPGLSGLGAALPLGAAGASAIASVFLKYLRVGGHLPAVTAWQLTLGAIPLLGASAIVEDSLSVEWSTPFVLLLAFLAVVGTSGALYTWYWLVQREDLGRLGVFLFGVPAMGLGLAWVVFDENLETFESIGLALVLAAILRIVVPRRRGAGSASGAGTGGGSPLRPDPGHARPRSNRNGAP